jgi:AbrB family looped-hinge helix DNA binding protein
MNFNMSEPTTMSIKGQVTIPREVRERLGLQAGDKIAWSLLSNGTVVVRPKTRRLVDLVGMLTKPGQPGVTVDEMRLPE